ncbi:hypothetical protein L6164_012782 [Bauhinia variegata]|uniref:Uncharacterized protein n=1 Tax=Bauhinia variegata TaxID=167791 RepID=A0ACB9PB23_BAUVA|nr:hypothetical protein L6164_012782 [Bauhinia variegata]
MAGRLPGVGVPPRKRDQHHRHKHYRTTYSYSNGRETLTEAPSVPVSAMDETALKARQRLEQKLGHLYSSICRSSYNSTSEGKESESGVEKKESGLSLKLLRKSCLLGLNRFKKERKMCAVCLEDFEEEEQVMSLSCSHKYHSACLLPWLAANPHCPYCRTPVHH